MNSPPDVRFAVRFLSCFLLLYGFHLAVIAAAAPTGWYVPWISDHFYYPSWWRHALLEGSAALVRTLGYLPETRADRLWVRGHGGVIVGYSCLGMGVCSFLTAYILCRSGPWLPKIGLSVAACCLVQLLNMFRLAGLCLVWKTWGGKMWISHHAVFNTIVYLAVVGMLAGTNRFFARGSASSEG